MADIYYKLAGTATNPMRVRFKMNVDITCIADQDETKEAFQQKVATVLTQIPGFKSMGTPTYTLL